MNGPFTFTKTIRIHASLAQIWEVLLDPDAIERFYFGIRWHTDWQKGSPIRFTGDYDHQPFEDKGFVLGVEQEEFLLFSYFNPDQGKADVEENYTVMRYELEASADGTLFTVFQYGFSSETAFETVVTKWDSVLAGVKREAEGRV